MRISILGHQLGGAMSFAYWADGKVMKSAIEVAVATNTIAVNGDPLKEIAW